MKITDEALYQHVAEARDIWLDALPKDDELPEHQFSDGFMSSLETMEVQEKAQHKKKSRSPFSRVAAVFLAVLIGSGTWLGINTEARAAFTQWIRDIWEDGVVYTFVGESPDTLLPDFHCSWLPEGMETAEFGRLNQQGYMVYFGENDLHCSLDYSYMQEGSAHFISPSGEDGLRHEVVEINGMPGDFYIESEDGLSHVLLWFDEDAGIAFSLHSNLPPEDILRMAESVKEGAVLELMPEYECTWFPDGYDSGKEVICGSHNRQISALGDGKDLRLKYEIFEQATLEEQFWIESETPGIPLIVWGEDAVLYLNTHRDENSLLWLDSDTGIAFRLDASEDEETMLQIAEHVKEK